MSSLKRKLEGEIEIRESAGDVFHDLYKQTPHNLPNVSPHIIHSCELHEGEFGKHGAVLIWNGKLGGKPHTLKCVIEEIDEEKKLVKQRIIEGHAIGEEYKSIVGTCQVISIGNETSTVKWTLEYEKMYPGVSEPSDLLDACLDVAKHIDDHHHAKS